MKLAVLQTVLFLLAFSLAGTGAIVLVRRAELRAAHAEIEELEDDASELIEQGRTADLIQKINAPQREPSRLYRLQDANGRWLGGRLPAVTPPRPEPEKYWSVFKAHGLNPPHARTARVLALVHPEPGGLRLVVAEDLSLREREDAPFLALALVAAAVVSGLGMGGGFVVAGRTLKRADELTRTVQGFAAGDRRRRAPLDRTGGAELDDLADALNDMMDREARLVEGLRQTSTAVAHDLRRPLAHHNHLIDDALSSPASESSLREALHQARARIEEVLATFQALLHIAELDAGAPGLALSLVDLNTVASRIYEAYVPLAEQGGRSLRFEPASGPANILGDARTLSRMTANLVENALVHTPQGTAVTISVGASPPQVVVADDGPGVPEPMLERIFDRFVRLDASRSTSGNGLGLALATATARAFGGVLKAENTNPGLRVSAKFPGQEVGGNL